MAEAAVEGERHASATSVLADLMNLGETERVSLGALVDALEERAFGLVLLLLALPCAVPFLYGVPQVVSLPMLAVAVQAVMGRKTLWLPERLRARTMARADLKSMLARAEPWLRRLEVLAHPRLTALAGPAFDRVLGLVVLIAACSIAVPLPLTNTVPGIGVAILAIGMIERDGLLILAGAVLALAWVVMLLTVGTAVLSWAAGLVTG